MLPNSITNSEGGNGLRRRRLVKGAGECQRLHCTFLPQLLVISQSDRLHQFVMQCNSQSGMLILVKNRSYCEKVMDNACSFSGYI